ncbi:MAG: hypothetical protein FWF70_07490 [Bacteroidetes bacterium]|nr:hypothetical protein [Bacteroidota bacterium]MCL1968970.1 hypothetical protein [Bacteroidota bacterium]
MADKTETTVGNPAENHYLETLAAKLLEQETSKEVQAIRLKILERIASESDVKPSRIPAPKNITEIGGYFNLMMKMKKEAAKEAEKEAAKKVKEEQKVFQDMLNQTLTSILGLPVQPPNV